MPAPVLSVVRDDTYAPVELVAMSPWEVTKKANASKLELPLPLGQWMKEATCEGGIRILPLIPEIAMGSAQLPGDFHRDPADQFILAVARLHGSTLITADQKILDYPHVGTLWV